MGPAASRPWPGPWVLSLAPAPSWALSGAPGRQDRRLRQRPGPWVKVFRSIMVGIVTASGSRKPGQGERIGEDAPPSSGATVAPAASRPWPGSLALPLAPAPSWALSGAPGRQDRRLRQRPGPWMKVFRSIMVGIRLTVLPPAGPTVKAGLCLVPCLSGHGFG